LLVLYKNINSYIHALKVRNRHGRLVFVYIILKLFINIFYDLFKSRIDIAQSSLSLNHRYRSSSLSLNHRYRSSSLSLIIAIAHHRYRSLFMTLVYHYRCRSLFMTLVYHYRCRSLSMTLVYHYHVFDFCCHQFHNLLCIDILFVIHKYHKKIRIDKFSFRNIYESSTIGYFFICSNIVCIQTKFSTHLHL
jgi:hypothetical protein